jgi:ectoine hydroxylase-related dioxygenase (phytanoyl-CoA dioxygenase family)
MTTGMTTAAAQDTRHQFSQAELGEFQRQGYLLKRGLFSPELMARLQAETEALHESEHRAPTPGVHLSWEDDLPAGRAPRIRQLMHSQLVSPILMAMTWSQELLAPMRQLIGPDLYLFHSKLLMKAAHDGTFTPWHQDFGYWMYHSKQPTQVNCMLAIDPADEANGAVRFVGGSHHGGLVEHGRLQSTSFGIGLPGGLEAYPGTVIDMQPGDGLFFGALVIHGSGPNASGRDRRANTFAFDRPANVLEGTLPAHDHRCGRKD